jgi:transcriptional regulator NrdR family protein
MEIDVKNPQQGIQCPVCENSQFRVVYTRHRDRKIIRVRACTRCNERILTHERMVGDLSKPTSTVSSTPA